MNPSFHQARKRFGQNFLVDASIIESIIQAVYPQKGENIIEIGPGCGALTAPLIESCGHITAIELDRDLIPKLKHQFGEAITLIEADVLKFDFNRLVFPIKSRTTNQSDIPAQAGIQSAKTQFCHPGAEAIAEEPGIQKSSLRLVGNLPYNISTPLLFHLMAYLEHIQDMHFMLQKEVVERLTAVPGNKDYGRLSIMIQYYCQAEAVLEVPPTAFEPAPKVDSMVVRLTPHQSLPHPVNNMKNLEQVVQQAFNQRRKTLSNALKNLLPNEQIKRLGIDPSLRPEQLTIANYVKLANSLN